MVDLIRAVNSSSGHSQGGVVSTLNVGQVTYWQRHNKHAKSPRNKTAQSILNLWQCVIHVLYRSVLEQRIKFKHGSSLMSICSVSRMFFHVLVFLLLLNWLCAVIQFKFDLSLTCISLCFDNLTRFRKQCLEIIQQQCKTVLPPMPHVCLQLCQA